MFIWHFFIIALGGLFQSQVGTWIRNSPSWNAKMSSSSLKFQVSKPRARTRPQSTAVPCSAIHYQFTTFAVIPIGCQCTEISRTYFQIWYPRSFPVTTSVVLSWRKEIDEQAVLARDLLGWVIIVMVVKRWKVRDVKESTLSIEVTRLIMSDHVICYSLQLIRRKPLLDLQPRSLRSNCVKYRNLFL